MRRNVRLYSVMFPIRRLCIVPRVWLIIIPGSLVIACLALLSMAVLTAL